MGGRLGERDRGGGPAPTGYRLPFLGPRGGRGAGGEGAGVMSRILMLSWEYPPLLVGGLGRHVHALATSLGAAGHEVTVVTRHAPGALREEYAEGVRIVRAPDDPPEFEVADGDPLAWTM